MNTTLKQYIVIFIFIFFISFLTSILITNNVFKNKEKTKSKNIITNGKTLLFKVCNAIKKSYIVIVSNTDIEDVENSKDIKKIFHCLKTAHINTNVAYFVTTSSPVNLVNKIMSIQNEYKPIEMAYDDPSGEANKYKFCNIYIPIKIWKKLDEYAIKKGK